MNTFLSPFFRLCTALVLMALPAQAITVNATFNSATDIPVISSGYTATGNTLNLTLNYGPAIGTELTVVKNTALPFIQGTFDNLAHGQNVTLAFGGNTYSFLANYHGGSGNDLVLVWAEQDAFGWGKNSNWQLGDFTKIHSSTPSAIQPFGALYSKTIFSFAAGGSHSLAVCSDGSLAAWGGNASGQLGDNSKTTRKTPITVGGLLFGKTVVAAAAGNSHSLALCSDGLLFAWGSNGSGQLGDNSKTLRKTPTPVIIPDGKSVVAIAAGANHSLALCSDGTLLAWGANSSGQLGDNTKTLRKAPVTVDQTGVLSGKTVVAIAAGTAHSLALCSDGTVAAWGNNSSGQLGNFTRTSSKTPVSVFTNSFSNQPIEKIAAGGNHNLAVTVNNELAAWGNNSAGQLGNGTKTRWLVPIAITPSFGSPSYGLLIKSLAAGKLHSTVLLIDGTLVTWGQNVYGQLGDGSKIQSSIPVNAGVDITTEVGRFTALSGGSSASHSLALTAPPGTASALTEIAVYNGSGTGGTERESNSGTFTFNSTLVGSSSSAQTFTIKNTGTANLSGLALNKTGSNSGDFTLGSLGSTTLTPGSTTTFTTAFSPTASGSRTATIQIASNDSDENPFFINVAGTGQDAITLSATYNNGSETPLTTNGFAASGSTVNFTLNYAPAVGTELMVVHNTGLPFIEGRFDNLAHGQQVDLSFGGNTYSFIANYYGGSGNDLVLTWASRRLFVWGNNDYGQLGDGSNTNKNTPVTADVSSSLAGKIILSTATRGYHSFALCSDGTLVSWGYNYFGQLGNGNKTSSNTPVLVNTSGVLAGKTIISIEAGRYHSLALCSDGTLVSWGYNESGELGNGNTTSSTAPVLVNTSGVLAGKTIISIEAGIYHSHALCSDGTLVSWGSNSSGRLGNGNTTNSSTPVLVNTSGVLAGKTIISIMAGYSHSLALCSDGTLVSWGENGSGQLGDGNTNDSTTPVLVNTSGVLAGKTIISIEAGDSHSLALCSDGTLVSWGYNGSGQLGNGNTTNGSTPVLVNTSGVLAGKTIISIEAGSYHSHALCSDGTLVSWGYNGDGQLGNASNTNSSTPVLVSNLSLRAGERFFNCQTSSSHNLTLVASIPFVEISIFNGSGTGGSERQSNTGTLNFSNTLVGSSSSAQTFTIKNTGAANLTGLALTNTGSNSGDFTLSSLGSTTLSPGSTTTFTATFFPTASGPRTATIQIASNDSDENPFLIQVTGNGQTPQAYNVTYNTGTETPISGNEFIATGSTVNFTLNYAPAVGTELMVVKNTGLPFIEGRFDNLAHGQQVDLSFGGNTYRFIANYYGGTGNDLVLRWAYTKAYGWGNNSVTQVGDNTTTNRAIPVLLKAPDSLESGDITAFSAGTSFSLAMSVHGPLMSWGGNLLGELGDGSTTPGFALVKTSGVLDGKTIVSIASGSSHSLALCSDGTLASWGSNLNGQLGRGNHTNSLSPVLVTTSGVLAGKTVVSIAAGFKCSIALCSDGTLATWGAKTAYYYDSGVDAPILVNTSGVLAGKTIVAMSIQPESSWAVCSDGTLVSWQHDTYTPTPSVFNSGALAGKSVVAIEAGGSHSLALCSDGTLVSWGSNSSGQLGNGNTTYGYTPVLVNTSGVLAGKTIISIEAGSYHSLALCSDGTMAAWGDNNRGQLGNGTFVNSNVPVLVTSSMLNGGLFTTPIGAGSEHSLATIALPLPPSEIAVFNGSLTNSANERQSNIGRFDFPVVTVGNSSTPQTLTIKNTGPSILTGLALSVTGSHPNDFTVSSSGATTLGAGETMTFTVTFSPTVAGDRNAVVQIASNDSDENPFFIKVSGRDYNNAPATTPDTIERVAMKSTKVSVAALVANDTDADGDTLVITAVDSATPVGTTVTTDGAWVYFIPPSDSAAPGGFSYTISDGHGGTAVGTVTVNIKGATNGTSLSQTKAQSEPAAGGGTQMRVTFIGIPGRVYTIQATDILTPPSWQSIGTATANEQGVYQFIDPPPLPPSRFYRSVYP